MAEPSPVGLDEDFDFVAAAAGLSAEEPFDFVSAAQGLDRPPVAEEPDFDFAAAARDLPPRAVEPEQEPFDFVTAAAGLPAPEAEVVQPSPIMDRILREGGRPIPIPEPTEPDVEPVSQAVEESALVQLLKKIPAEKIPAPLRGIAGATLLFPFGGPALGSQIFKRAADLREGNDRVSIIDNVINSVLQGAYSSLAAIPKDVALISRQVGNAVGTPDDAEKTKVDDTMLFQLGKTLDGVAEDLFPQDKDLQNSFFATIVPQGMGQMLSLMLPGGLLGKASALAKVGAASSIGHAMGAVQQFEDATGFTTSEEDQLTAAALGGLIGMSDAFLGPLFRWTQRLDKASGGTIKKALINASIDGLVEAFQETVQTAGGNAVARQIYDENRKMFDGAGMSAAGGGTVGLIMSLMISALGMKMRGGGNFKSDNPFEPIDLSGERVSAESDQATEALADGDEVIEQAPIEFTEVGPRDEVNVISSPESDQQVDQIDRQAENVIDGNATFQSSIDTGNPEAINAAQTQMDTQQDALNEQIENMPTPITQADGSKQQDVFNTRIESQAKESNPNNLRTGINDQADMNDVSNKGSNAIVENRITEAQQVARDILITKANLDKRSRQLMVMQTASVEAMSRIDADVGNVDPADIAIVGAARIAEGTSSFDMFSEDMTGIFGKSIKSSLPNIYEMSKAIHGTQTAETALNRPDLSQLFVNPQARDLLNVVDGIRNEEGLPEKVTFEQTHAVADKRIDADLEGEFDKVSEGVFISGSMDDMLTAMKAMDAKGLDVISTENTEDIIKITQGMFNLRESRSEVGRVLAIGVDPIATPAERARRGLVGIMFEPTDATMRKVKDKSPAEKKRILVAEQVKLIKEMKKRLAKQGVDISKLNPEDFADPTKMANIMRTIGGVRASFMDMATEWWINGILSGLTTQTANILGNTLNTTWEYTGQRFTEASINLMAGNKDGTTFGELFHAYSGMYRASANAAGNALLALRTEQPVFQMQESGSSRTKFETSDRRHAIPGTFGRVVRIPGTFLVAADEFAKTLIAGAEVNAQAYRIAKREGAKGNDLSKRMNELTSDQSSEAWSKAFLKARELTFQQDVGQIAESLLNFRKKVPAVKFLLPFISTPANIARTGFRKSPLGVLNLLKKASRGELSNKDEASRLVAEQLTAWVLMMSIGALVTPDEDSDLPIISGSEPIGSTQERVFKRRVMPPFSIRVGDRVLSYERIEPIATVLGVTVDLLNAYRQSQTDPEKAAKTLWGNLISQVKNKVYLKAIGDIIRFATEPELRGFPGWISNFAASWIPNIVRSGIRNTDPLIRSQKIRERGVDVITDGIPRRIFQKAFPVEDFMPPPIVDTWGRPLRKHEGKHPATDWLYRMIVPIRQQEEMSTTNLDRLILNWNNENPDDEYWPSLPQAFINDPKTKERIFLTEEQYHRYSELSGQMAFAILEQRTDLNFGEPTKRDRNIVKKVIDIGRKRARREILKDIRQ